MRTTRIAPGDRSTLDEVARHLEGGGLLGYPTETVYGLGARVAAAEIERLRQIKDREERLPFLVLVPDVSHTERMGLEWRSTSRALANAFWPGPLTLVLPEPDGGQPDGVRGPTGGVAVRVSPDPLVRALMEVWHQGLLSTSANVSGDDPARTADELREALEHRTGSGGLWILDGGRRESHAPSTIVDCTAERPRVARPGPIGLRALRKIVPDLDGPHALGERLP